MEMRALDSNNVRPLVGFQSHGVRATAPQSLEQLFDLYRGLLVSAAARRLSTDLQIKASPSDLVQETLETACQVVDRFSGETEAELLAWLLRILQRRCSTARRRYRDTQKRRLAREVTLDSSACDRSPTLSDADRTPCALAIAHEESALVRQVVRTLPHDYRRVLILRNWERLPFQEIGQRMGRSTKASQKLWTRALVCLQCRLTLATRD